MPSKDVVYIEKDTSVPYVCFGSRMAKNLVLQHAVLPVEKDTGLTKLEEWNRIVVDSVMLKEIKELVSRMAFVEIEMIDGDQGFFNSANTIKIMEGWDDNTTE